MYGSKLEKETTINDYFLAKEEKTYGRKTTFDLPYIGKIAAAGILTCVLPIKI